MRWTCLLFTLIFFSTNSFSQDLTQSELPIVVINTNGQSIPDEPKIQATMGIIDTEGAINQISDPFTEYDGNIGIETRGNSTQGFDKKTYSIELWDDANQDISVNLLGMGGEEDWILHAMVIDKTQLRIPMSFYLSQQMGHYAAKWKYVELVLNGEYRGLYILTERLKRDDDRVDIAKLDSDDLAGDSLTGGYILRIDWTYDIEDEDYFLSEFESQGGNLMPFQYYYPKANNIQPAQKAYIKSFMDEFEAAVFADDYQNMQGNRYTDYIDVTAFADFLLINEFSKNSDGYKLSSYVHKDRDDNDPRLKAGPIWDFDQTYGLSVVCSSHITSGWTYLQNQDGCEDLESMPMWWQSMMADTLFQNYLDCRWTELRQGAFHQDSLYNWIDNYVAMLANPLERNFERWDFIGEYIWIEPDNIPETYEGEIEYLKNWIAERLSWMDQNLPGNCDFNILSLDAPPQLPEFNVFPNPTDGLINLYPTLDNDMVVSIYNSVGQQVQSIQGSNFSGTLDLSIHPKGVYLIQIASATSSRTYRIVLR